MVGDGALIPQEEKHPADEIGKALSRAGGILSSLTNCYEKSETDFQISMNFIFEAIMAVEKLVIQSSADLTRLYDAYDLSKLVLPLATEETQLNGEAGQEENVPVDFEIDSDEEQSHERPYRRFFPPTEQVTELATRIDHILETMPVTPKSIAAEELLDKPAQSYNELFDKLTAMVDAAADQAHQSPDSDQSLLPVLETLRADMNRIRSVA